MTHLLIVAKDSTLSTTRGTPADLRKRAKGLDPGSFLIVCAAEEGAPGYRGYLRRELQKYAGGAHPSVQASIQAMPQRHAEAWYRLFQNIARKLAAAERGFPLFPGGPRIR